MDLIKVRGLSVHYGAVQALVDVNVDIKKGCITAIIGSNGAGKTTLINAISGMVHRKGDIFFNDKPLSSSSNKVVRNRIIQVPEGRRIFAGLTVEENLLVGAYSMHDRKLVSELMEKQYVLFPRLKERKDQDAGTLSGGEQQMLAISRAMMANPSVLMLDEPSLGLAPIIVSEVFNNIQKIKENEVTIILVEQNAKKSLSIADYGYVLENGKVILSGTGQELLHNAMVSNAYLGTARK